MVGGKRVPAKSWAPTAAATAAATPLCWCRQQELDRLPGNYVIVCDDGQPRRTVFLGVFGEGVSRNSLAPDERLVMLADHLAPPAAGGSIVDDNALFLPVLALTPLLGNSVRPGLWDDYLHPNPYDAPLDVAVNKQLSRLYGFVYAQALRIAMHSHIVGRASGDAGTGGDARRKTLLQAYEALQADAGANLAVGRAPARRPGDAPQYPVAEVRTALNTQPDTARLTELHALL